MLQSEGPSQKSGSRVIDDLLELSVSSKSVARKSGVPACHLAMTTQWLNENFETCDSRISISREKFFHHYKEFADSTSQQLMNQASFGKLLRSLFHLSTRRLGVRGHSKYHYSGIKVKDDSPLRCIAQDIEVESMDFSGSIYKNLAAQSSSSSSTNQVAPRRPSIRPKKAAHIDDSVVGMDADPKFGDVIFKSAKLNSSGSRSNSTSTGIATFHSSSPSADHRQLQQNIIGGGFSIFGPAILPPVLEHHDQPQGLIDLAPMRQHLQSGLDNQSFPLFPLPTPSPFRCRFLDVDRNSQHTATMPLSALLPDTVSPIYSDNTILVPPFAQSRAYGKTNKALAKEASGFLAAYQEHSQNIANVFFGERPGDLPALVHTFWTRVSVAASPLFWQKDVLWDVAMADLTVYSVFLNEFDKEPLNSSTIGRLAYMVFNLEEWTNSANQGTLPAYLFYLRNAAIGAFREAFTQSASKANALHDMRVMLENKIELQSLQKNWEMVDFGLLRKEICDLLSVVPFATAEAPEESVGTLTSPKRRKSTLKRTSSSPKGLRQKQRRTKLSKQEPFPLACHGSATNRRLSKAFHLPSDEEMTSLIHSNKLDKYEEVAARCPKQSKHVLEIKDDHDRCADEGAHTESEDENESLEKFNEPVTEQVKAKMIELILDTVEIKMLELINSSAPVEVWCATLEELLDSCVKKSYSENDYLEQASHFLRQLSFVNQQIIKQHGYSMGNDLRPFYILSNFMEHATLDKIRKNAYEKKLDWYERQTSHEIGRMMNPTLASVLDNNLFFGTVAAAVREAHAATLAHLPNIENHHRHPHRPHRYQTHRHQHHLMHGCPPEGRHAGLRMTATGEPSDPLWGNGLFSGDTAMIDV